MERELLVLRANQAKDLARTIFDRFAERFFTRALGAMVPPLVLPLRPNNNKFTVTKQKRAKMALNRVRTHLRPALARPLSSAASAGENFGYRKVGVGEKEGMVRTAGPFAS